VLVWAASGGTGSSKFDAKEVGLPKEEVEDEVSERSSLEVGE
jgi:hypothetical protein